MCQFRDSKFKEVVLPFAPSAVVLLEPLQDVLLCKKEDSAALLMKNEVLCSLWGTEEQKSMKKI